MRRRMGCLVGFVEMYRTTAYHAGYVALGKSWTRR
jgi:hypothetical protein